MAEMEIKRNERVVALDGTEVGHVTHVIVDGPTHQVTDIVVQHDGQDLLVPISNVERSAGNALTLRGTPSQFAGAAAFNRAGYHEVDEDEIEGTPARSMPGAAVVEHADRNSVTIANTTTAATAPVSRRQTETTTAVPQRTTERVTETPARATERATETPARAASASQVRDGQEITVPVVEEQLRAGVREVDGGRFRLRKSVTTEQQNIDVPVRREEAYVTERAVNRPATQEDLATMDQDISVPLRDQEVVTSKQAVVTGEVGIRKETVTETERVSDSVRREEVHVEDPRDPHIHVEGNLTAAQRAQYDTMNEAERARYGRFTQQERTQYDAMTPEQQRVWVADYDRRNPLEKAADKITGRD